MKFYLRREIMYLLLLLLFPLLLAAEPSHLIDLRTLQENVQPQDNHYVHREIDVTWKGYEGATRYRCYTYCSGLVEALLTRAYGFTTEDYFKWLHRKHPRSEDFHLAIVKQENFLYVKNIQELLPGDLIALKYPNEDDREPGDSSGHIMVADSVAQEWKPTPPIVEKTKQWVISVIDCSQRGHGRDDTRYLSPGKYKQGIGKGTFRIYTNEEKTIIGYAWSTSKESIFYPNEVRQIAAGRLILEPK